MGSLWGQTPKHGCLLRRRHAAGLAALALAALAAVAGSPGTALAAQTPDLPLIGRSAVVTNDVEGQLPAAPERKQVVVNEDIFLNETMYTVSDSSMVVEFRDGSTLELGPDAVFTIDKLVFNPEKSTTEKAVNILQGTFRYVSGFAVDKQTVDIKTPSGTLGIRGSVVIGLVDPKLPTFIYVAQGIASFANQAGFQELVSGRAVVVRGPNSPPSPSSVIPPQVIAQTIAAILKHLPPVSLTNNRPPMTPAQAARFAEANALALAQQLEQQKKLSAALEAAKARLLALVQAEQKAAAEQEAAKAKALAQLLAALKSADAQEAAKARALALALAQQLEQLEQQQQQKQDKQKQKSADADEAAKLRALALALAQQLEQQQKAADAQEAAKAKALAQALAQQLEQLQQKQKSEAAALEKELTLLVQAEKLGLLTGSQKTLTAEQQQFLRDAELVIPNAQAYLNRTKDEQQKFNAANAQLAVATVLADMAKAGVPQKVLAEAIIAAMRRQPQFDVAIARALASSSSPQTLLAILASLMDTAPRLSKQLADAMTNSLKARHDIAAKELAELTQAIDKSAAENKRVAEAGGGKTGAGSGITKEQALAAILSGTEKDLKLLQKFFDQSGSPKAVVALTHELIDLMRENPAFKDLAKLQAVADQIAKIAADSINSVHVLKVAVDPKMILNGRQRGFEFGPPDMKKFANFESVPPKDPRINGKDVRGLRRPEQAPLLGSGISGVQTVQLSVPNGEYRIILVTGNTGIPNLMTAPLGQDVAVNGQNFHVAGGGSPDTWQGLITLGDSGVGALGGDTGGAIILVGKVTDGVLVVDLNGVPGSTFLAAMVIEPFGEPSIIAEAPSEDTWFDLDGETRTEALAEIDDAIGTLLSDIATAAGPDQLAQNLGLPNQLPTDTPPISGN